MRVRSRAATCSTGSTPFCKAINAHASEDMRGVADGLSVKLTASTYSFNMRIFLTASAGSAVTGGEISAVMANPPSLSTRSSLETGSCGGAGCGRASPCHQSGWRTS